MTVRRQATLYLPPPFKIAVESVRSRFNPIQFALIPAHVTLCREDEVRNWDEFVSRVSALYAIDVQLSFGLPIRESNFVYVQAVGSTESFDALRDSLLATNDLIPRRHKPHITLVHPRNGTCSDSEFEQIACRYAPFSATFRCITLIEQTNDSRWKAMASFR